MTSESSAQQRQRLEQDARRMGLTLHQYIQLVTSLREIRRRG